MGHVDTIERHYKSFVDQADEIACGADYRQHADLGQYWEKWHAKHVALKKRYDATIKRDPRFPKLFRPGRESRWSDIESERGPESA